MNPRVLIALLLTVVVGLAGVLLVARARDHQLAASGPAPAAPPASRFEGSLLPPGVRAPDYPLRDQDGEPVRSRGVPGHPTIVTFLYTTCEESCPAQAQQIKGALNELGHDVPALAIAVDPPRDTPARARGFLAEARMTGRMDLGLGSRRELEPVWRGYYIQPQSANAEHQARIVLVDRAGYQRVGYPLDQVTPERLAHDVRALESE